MIPSEEGVPADGTGATEPPSIDFLTAPVGLRFRGVWNSR